VSTNVTKAVWALRDCTASQKLVLARLADYASLDGTNVFPKQKSVSEDCGCDVRTVQRVIKWACSQGFLEEEPGPGNKAKRYRFNLEAVRQGVRVTHSQGDTQSPSVRHTVALSTTHSRAINKEPLINHQLTTNGIPFPSEKFAEIWSEWITFRIEKKKTLTQTTIKRQFQQLGKVPESEAIAMLEQSITNGWTGIFPVKDSHLKVEKGGVDDGGAAWLETL